MINFGDICVFVLLVTVAFVSAVGYCAIKDIWPMFSVFFYSFLTALMFITALIVWVKERLL